MLPNDPGLLEALASHLGTPKNPSDPSSGANWQCGLALRQPNLLLHLFHRLGDDGQRAGSKKTIVEDQGAHFETTSAIKSYMFPGRALSFPLTLLTNWLHSSG